jgi:hypothetical protein
VCGEREYVGCEGFLWWIGLPRMSIACPEAREQSAPVGSMKNTCYIVFILRKYLTLRRSQVIRTWLSASVFLSAKPIKFRISNE